MFESTGRAVVGRDGDASVRLAAVLDEPAWELDWDREFSQWLGGLGRTPATPIPAPLPTATTRGGSVPQQGSLVHAGGATLRSATVTDLLADHCACGPRTDTVRDPVPDVLSDRDDDADAARIVNRIARARRLEAQAVWRQVVELSHLLDTWQGQGGPDDDLVPASVLTEVALACSMSEYAVGRRLDAAWALISDTRLPRLAALMEDGGADWAKVSMLVRETAVLSADAANAVDALVVDLVPELNVPRLTAAVRAAIAAVDPSGQAERCQEAHRRRGVTFRPAEDGMGEIGVWAPLEAVAAVRVQLDAAVARANAAGDRRGPGEVRCDELIRRVTGAPWSVAGDGSVESERPEPAEPPRGHQPSRLAVTLTMPLSTWLGLRDDPATLDGGHTMAGRLARDLAVEMARGATWRCAVVDDEHGTLLGLGRPIRTPGYVPAPRLATFARTAEPLCCVPGCGARAHRCDLDHRIPYPDGATCSCNLQTMCRRHHRLKTAGHLRSRTVDEQIAPAGTIEWTTRSGRTYLRPPTSLLPFTTGSSTGSGATRIMPARSVIADPDPPPF